MRRHIVNSLFSLSIRSPQLTTKVPCEAILQPLTAVLTNRVAAFKVSTELDGVMSHLICSVDGNLLKHDVGKEVSQTAGDSPAQGGVLKM